MLKGPGKVLTAVLFLSVAAFLFSSIYTPGYASREQVSQNTVVPIPGEVALNITRHAESFARSIARNNSGSMSCLYAAGDLHTIMQTSQEQVTQLVGYIKGQNSKIPVETALEEASAFLHYSMKYNVPLDLAVAVANTESHFDPAAESSHGSAGVMQVTWRVHSALLRANGILEKEDLHDPRKGIAAGCLLISRYLRAYGDTRVALGRYYGGSASVYWGRVSKNLAQLRKFTR